MIILPLKLDAFTHADDDVDVDVEASNVNAEVGNFDLNDNLYELESGIHKNWSILKVHAAKDIKSYNYFDLP